MSSEMPEREVIAKRLDELADAVTKGPEVMRSEFTMRVPAEPGRDADLVLSTAAMLLRESSRAQIRREVVEEIVLDMEDEGRAVISAGELVAWLEEQEPGNNLAEQEAKEVPGADSTREPR